MGAVKTFAEITSSRTVEGIYTRVKAEATVEAGIEGESESEGGGGDEGEGGGEVDRGARQSRRRGLNFQRDDLPICVSNGLTCFTCRWAELEWRSVGRDNRSLIC